MEPQRTNEAKPCAPAVIRIDEQRRQVTVKGRPVAVTPTEFRLLAALLARPGEALARKELARLAMGDAIVGDRTVDVHLAALRRKLGIAGQQIKAVRGVGYRFEREAS
ncbi:MAG TPA: winged helix-turn-helix domain-containing protein [Gemmataceae bacterium]|nr:winged helix-turn-helix domain-containing protein [Gemmataceae bacterium]